LDLQVLYGSGWPLRPTPGGIPQWGDYAIVKVKDGSETPDLVPPGQYACGWGAKATPG
jgi:hypothetical protein